MMFYCLRAKFLILFQCKPHVRGDGPAVDDILLDFAGVNPTYMGMNRGGIPVILEPFVNPAHVGMNHTARRPTG